MKIPCQACGHENELGRIFCSDCGGKLDMSQMSMEQVSAASHAVSAGSILKWVGGIVLVLVVVSAGLALWPQAPFQEGVAQAGSTRVRAQLQGVQATLRAGGQTTVSLAQRDLNAYLDTFRARAGLQSITADVRNGAMVMRLRDQWGPWNIGSFSLGPLTYSSDLRIAGGGARYRVTGTKIGRLPLVGPLARLVEPTWSEAFRTAQIERSLLDKLERIEFEAEQVNLAFRP